MVIVLFKTRPRADVDAAAYEAVSERMSELASKAAGFVSFRRCTSDDGDSFAMVTFENVGALKAWRRHPEHVEIRMEEKPLGATR